MMKKGFTKVLAAVLSTVLMMTAVPVAAAEQEVAPEAKVASTDEVIVEVEMGTLKSIDTCKPSTISTGLEDYQYYILTPGYGIEQHTDIALYVTCPHESGYVTIRESMCSSYRTDLIDEIQNVTVTYNGVSVVVPIMYQYPMSFSDVSTSDWFYNSVEFVDSNGIMTGMSDSYFGAYESLSRAQFAVILHRLEAEPGYTTTKTFPDVPAGSWYEDAVLWAYEAGIITGYQNGYFGPADYITREQMAVMIYRYLTAFLPANGHADLSRFHDAAHVSPFATEAFAWAVGNGIITGKDAGTRLAPMETATRAECAVIIERFMTWIMDNYM